MSNSNSGVKAGTKSRLSQLHSAFTEALIKELQDAEADNIPLPAADKSVIAKFLKDNDITADADSVEINLLKDSFEDELAAKRLERSKQIMGKIAGDGELHELGIL